MRPELAGAVQGALAIFGGFLQYLRASKSISDWFTLSFGAIMAVVVWALAVDWNKVNDWQAFILTAIPTIGGCVSSVMGGTFLAAKAANSANDSSSSMDPKSALIPATDSKK